EEFLEDLQGFVGLENSGIFLRTVIDGDYAATNYYAAHFVELYGFYAERLCSLLYGGVDNPSSIENEETLYIRQKIIDAIELIFYELEEICKAYLEPEKIDKISIMSQPNIGYEGTIKLFKKIRTFVEKHATIFNRIYIHERDIIIFSKSVNNDVEPNIVPVLNLPILNYEDIKKSCERVLKHLKAVTAFYTEKYNELLGIDDEIEFVKKDKKVSVFDRFTRKKKEIDPIESYISVEESNAINTDNAPPIKRRSSLLQSLSPRSRTQSLKKISIDEIDKKVDWDSIELNTSAEIKPRKRRSSSILKVLTPRVFTPRSPHGDGLNRGSSDSKLSPKKITLESTPRPKSGDDYIVCKRSNSLPHSDSDIMSRSEIISKLEQFHLGNDTHKKISKIAVSPRMEKKKKSKKKEKKDRKKEKKDKKRQKSSAKPVDKIKFSRPYENPFNE
ncbi:MAG: hypothetical protein Q8K37_07975, partial [Alphaproteobacteria bacterium]|nr:hypothetical protein [Alphaproteobacteria bacterium]